MAHFEVIRDNATHPGTMGDASESRWIKVLRDFLPERYIAQKAAVIDGTGQCSEQIDVVIYDRQYSPLVLNQSGLIYVPAESVYAVIEAKQDINKSQVEYAADKAASVRRLVRTSVEIPHAGGVYSAKKLHHIIAGIVTLSSEWNPPLGDAFESVIQDIADDRDRQLEIGCVLGAGAFAIKYSGANQPFIYRSDPKSALLFFLFTLFDQLRSLGTVPALDISEYAKWLTPDGQSES